MPSYGAGSGPSGLQTARLGTFNHRCFRSLAHLFGWLDEQRGASWLFREYPVPAVGTMAVFQELVDFHLG